MSRSRSGFTSADMAIYTTIDSLPLTITPTEAMVTISVDLYSRLVTENAVFRAEIATFKEKMKRVKLKNFEFKGYLEEDCE